MKVYVLNVATQADRLQHFKETYPKCLPTYTIWKAKTGNDVEVPDWWCSSANRWALVQNYIDILSEETDEDILIFEDDCTFSEDFENKYNLFLNEVPDDWDMLYLGALHVSPPIQVSTGILRLRDSVCGHAIIYRNSIRQELIDYYKEPVWGCSHAPDERRAQAMVSCKFKAYAPFINICGQDTGYSTLESRNRGTRWYNSFRYITSDGIQSEVVNGKQKFIVEPIEPIQELTGKEICSVSVAGESIFYAVCFLLKVQELQKAFNMPIVCHVDALNKERIVTMAEQEAIDISDVIFVEHKLNNTYDPILWRYMPVGAAITHVFDVDNSLHPAQVFAVKDFKENGSGFDVYTCKYLYGSFAVLGGSIGFRETILDDLFNCVNSVASVVYGTDEYTLETYLSRNATPCLMYRVKGRTPNRHKTLPAGVFKDIDGMTINNMVYKNTDFEKLAYYADSKYRIDDKEYIVRKNKH